MKVSDFSISPVMFVPGDEVTITLTVKAESGDTIGEDGLAIWLRIPGYGEMRVFRDASFVITKGKTKSISTKAVLTFTKKFERGSVVSFFGVQLGYGGSRVDVDFPITLLDAWYKPSVSAFVAERSSGAIPNDEGENLLLGIALGKSTAANLDTMSLYLYYQDKSKVDTDPVSINLTSLIQSALVSEIDNVIYEVFDKNADWNLLLWFGDKYESTTSAIIVSRSFANVHLSGASSGGVCFGSFSKATEGNPLFECCYPSEFYAPARFDSGIYGLTNYALGEVKTGGKWIDGKDIFRQVAWISVDVVNKRKDNLVEGFPQVSTLIDLRASLVRDAEDSRRYPAQFWYADNNYHSVWLEYPDSVSAKTSHTLKGYVIIEYTKA